jgi:hypothetical protein
MSKCLLVALVTALWLGPASACVEGDLRGEAVTLEREVGSTDTGRTAALNVMGAGWFRAAEVVKHGGTTDQTVVSLELDGQSLFTTSFASLKNKWMQLGNSYIVADVKTDGADSIMTIWYSPELKFRVFALVRVDVQEEGVDGLRLRTVMNKPAPHEHLPGQTALALPAFK